MLAQAIRSVFRTARNPGPTDDFWYRPAWSPVAAGVTVNESTAMMLSTWWACLRVLTDTVGCLPIHVYRWESNERKSKDPEHEWYVPLHDKPNAWQTPIEFKSMLVGHLLLRGNFYARIDPPLPQIGENYPSLVPLNPDRMQPPKQDRYNRLTYEYRYQDGRPQTFQQDDILHVKLLTTDGFMGMSPLAYARETLGLATAQQGYASSIFSGGGFLKYYLKTSKRLGAEGRKNFREGWRDLHGDPRHFEPPILEDDMSIQTLGMNNEDAQFLESRKFSAYELCQFMGVPPHLVFLLDRATWANTELQGIDFLTVHLNPYLVRIEQCLQPLMQETHFAEFLRDAVVRGDLQSRYSAYNTGIQAGFLTRNEVRARENLDPLPGGDVLLSPLNMTPVDENGMPVQPKQPEPPAMVVEDEEEKDDEPQAVIPASIQYVTLATQDEPVPVTIERPVETTDAVTLTFSGPPGEVTEFVKQLCQTPEPEQQPEPTSAAQSVDLSPIAEDVAQRIVAREIIALNARLEVAKKVGDNIKSEMGLSPAEAYFRWAVEWFERHREYVTKAIAPLFTVAHSATDPTVTATEYCDSTVQEFASREPADVLKDWQATKAGRLAETLKETIRCIPTS